MVKQGKIDFFSFLETMRQKQEPVNQARSY